MCWAAFQKIFRKIFSDVWKRRRKRQTQEKYHQRSHSEIVISVEGEITINCAISRQRNLAKARSRSTRREIAPSIARSRRSSDWRSAPLGARSPPAIVRLTVRFLLLSRARSLSLSLSFRKYFEIGRASCRERVFLSV